MTHPRLLIVSSSVFNQTTGGGVLLTNLFKGWPADRLAAAHADPVPPEGNVCNRYFRLGREEIHWAYPFSMVQPRPSNGGAVQQAVAGAKQSGSFARRLLGNELPWDARVSPDLAAWIEAFDPQAIYTLAGGPFMRLTLQIAKRWNLPIASHVMDDWPSVVGEKGLLGPIVRHRSLSDLKCLLTQSQLRLVISDAMKEAYARRYGFDFEVFQNGVDLSARRPLARKRWDASSPFRLLYIGSILPEAQLDSLAEIARVVAKMGAQGDDVELAIHSASAEKFRERLSLPPRVRIAPSLGDNEVFQALAAADLLVIPVNFDAASLRYIRFSMPAKVPLYMASGTPILLYGPEETAVVSYARKERWGLTVTQPEPAHVESAIRDLMGDDARREALGRRALTLAEERHDLARVRPAFQRAIAGMARRD